MPIYVFKCPSGHVFDEIFGSFSSADAAIKQGVFCQKCDKKAKRSLDPKENMSTTNDLPKRYGVWSYGGSGS